MTLNGISIIGGVPRRIAKGDYALVPANTPHQYTEVQGLVILTLHMPKKS
jgi:quercetin dioxygenase-like cupin family protein